MIDDWAQKIAVEVAGVSLLSEQGVLQVIERHCPFKRDLTYIEVKSAPTSEGPLLQCIDCKNTESPAGAMARYFNHGRCVHCGGYFKVVRA